MYLVNELRLLYFSMSHGIRCSWDFTIQTEYYLILRMDINLLTEILIDSPGIEERTTISMSNVTFSLVITVILVRYDASSVMVNVTSEEFSGISKYPSTFGLNNSTSLSKDENVSEWTLICQGFTMVSVGSVLLSIPSS